MRAFADLFAGFDDFDDFVDFAVFAVFAVLAVTAFVPRFALDVALAFCLDGRDGSITAAG